jgi:hypothetical protein
MNCTDASAERGSELSQNGGRVKIDYPHIHSPRLKQKPTCKTTSQNCPLFLIWFNLDIVAVAKAELL